MAKHFQQTSVSEHLQARCPIRHQRGVALVITLLLLALLSALGLVMYLSVASDALINGYYENYRASFYAADSGLNIARQQLVNEFQTGMNIGGTWSTPPISNPATLATTVTSYITSNYGSATNLNSGDAAGSWNENFKITGVTVSLATGYPQPGCLVSGSYTCYQYIYNYSLTSQGSSKGTEQAITSETGAINFTLTGATGYTTNSFAAYGTFLDQFPVCDAPFAPGTMTGPMFTNGAWQFGTSGSYIFTNQVGQANADFDFWFGNNCIQSATGSYKSGNQTIKPTFEGGYALGQPTVALPQNDFSQQWAVLNGLGTETAAPTNANMNAVLNNISGTAYPSSGSPSSGVYLPYSTSGSTNTMTGGGIYVAGNASVQLSTSGSTAEVYTITQSSTTTTVTIDPQGSTSGMGCGTGTTGTTVIKKGATTTKICGVPENSSGSTASPATMLYVAGNITSLTGPSSGAAVQNDTAITVTASGNITQTGSVTYATEPVTTTANQSVNGTCCSGDPADTLIPGNNNGQVLGIFTAGGNFIINPTNAGGTIEMDASIATISQGGSGGLQLGSNCPSAINIVGGRINNTVYTTSCSFTRNVYFDQRFTADAGFAPPWFPAVTQQTAQATPVALSSSPTVQRISWVDQSTLD